MWFHLDCAGVSEWRGVWSSSTRCGGYIIASAASVVESALPRRNAERLLSSCDLNWNSYPSIVLNILWFADLEFYVVTQIIDSPHYQPSKERWSPSHFKVIFMTEYELQIFNVMRFVHQPAETSFAALFPPLAFNSSLPPFSVFRPVLRICLQHVRRYQTLM